VINSVYSYFPPDTIHVVIVDPGVGSNRKAIILKTPAAYFVAPDNGVLSYVVNETMKVKEGRSSTDHATACRRKIAGQEGFALNQITNKKYMLKRVSSTFHGRDVFAPVAAHLSLGVPPGEFGRRLNSVNVFPRPVPERTDGRLTGRVIYLDSFGNLITNIGADDLGATNYEIKIDGFSIPVLSRFYEEKEGLIAIIGSSGFLEISLTRGSAEAFLKARVGDEVEVVF
jgi:S-adenosyl-L-methionine hydrolase (adenosine-forming)